MKRWYESLFANYSATYDREPFTQGTTGEVDFIEEVTGGNRQTRILDIGCGTGRHSIELTRRGYSVTGVDLSEAQLARARSKAAAEELDINFLLRDARALDFHREFDLALMICEGAFPLMETDEMNFQILDGAARALVPGGKLILTTLNALFPLFHSVKDFINDQGSYVLTEGNTFDLMTFRDRSTVTAVDDDGKKMILECDERYYTPSEITWLLKSQNFFDIEILGCQCGNFSRDRPLTIDDFEMLVLATLGRT